MKRIIWIGLMLITVLLTLFCAVGIAEETIALNTEKTVIIDAPGAVKLFLFTPETTGIYRFVSFKSENDNSDTCGYLLDGDRLPVAEDKDGGNDKQFVIQRKLTAGRTYYFGAAYDNETVTGSFTVKLEKIEGLTAFAVKNPVYVRENKTGTVAVDAFSTNGGVTYQWYEGETAISGATAATYSFPALTEAKEYRCKVTDGASQSAWIPVSARIDSGLLYSVDGGGIVAYGSSEDLTVDAFAAYGDNRITYQWFIQEKTGPEEWENIPLEGETGAILHLDNITCRGDYFCDVTDINGETKRCWFTVEVSGKISATAVQEKITVAAGSPATMEVKATSDYAQMGYTYEWYRVTGEENILLSGTASTYTIPTVSTVQNYLCIVTDGVGNMASVPFHVAPQGTFTAVANGDTSITPEEGKTITFSVTAESTFGGLRYQWFRYSPSLQRNLPITGAESDEYILVAGNTQTGEYECQVWDAVGNSKKITFSVTDGTDFIVTDSSGKNSHRMLPGETEILKVDVNPETEGMLYRWYRSEFDPILRKYTDRVLLEGETTNSLTAIGGESCKYECVVTNRSGVSRSAFFNVYYAASFGASHDEQNSRYRNLEPDETIVMKVRTTGDVIIKWVKYEHGDTSKQKYLPNRTDTLTIEHPTKDDYTTYEAFVSDDYGNGVGVVFDAKANNDMTATAVSNQYPTIEYGDSVTMEVTGNCKNGDVSYQWYRRVKVPEDSYLRPEIIPGATESTYSTGPVRELAKYYCKIQDEYGNWRYIDFNITVLNDLTAVADGADEIRVKQGDSATMGVIADCSWGSVAYQWYRMEPYTYTEGGTVYWREVAINGKTDATYTTGAVNTMERYMCSVVDEFGETIKVNFTVYVDNGLTVSRVGDYTRKVAMGEAVELSVTAECIDGMPTFQWYQTDKNNWQTYSMAIEGATTPSYSPDTTQETNMYFCRVSDPFGNTSDIYFELEIDIGLTAEAQGEILFSTIPANLGVTVSSLKENVEYSYQWYQDFYTQISGATQSTYTATAFGNYSCRVSACGNEAEVFFCVSENSGEAYAMPYGKISPQVDPGEQVTLKVLAANPQNDITYQWIDDNGDPIEGATGAEYTLIVNCSKWYQCHVEGTGINADYSFYPQVLNYFYIENDDGGAFRIIPENESIQLRVDVTSMRDQNLILEWYKDNEIIPDETSNTLTVTEAGEYMLLAMDHYNNMCDRHFECLSQEPSAISPGTTYSYPGYYQFTPAESGIYLVETNDYINIYRKDEYSSLWSQPGTQTMRLSATQTYYFELYEGSSIRFDLETEEADEFTFSMKAGQKIRISDLMTNGSRYYCILAKANDSSVIKVNGSYLQAMKAGSTTVTAYFDNGNIKMIYHITVLQNGGMRLPATLETIESDAFSGDSSIDYIELGRRVQTVKSGALSGLGNVTVLVKNNNVVFEDGAFGDSSPVIFCPSGTSVESYCINRGIPFFYSN